MTWNKPVADIEIITGYQLFMFDVAGGETKMIYDGARNPNLVHWNQANLTPGNEYGFSVIAYNFNGKGN